LGPRVPDLRGARLLALGGMALLGLRFGFCAISPPSGPPAEPESICLLPRLDAEPPCSCEGASAAIRWALGLPLRLNEAGAADLRLLPGVGPVRARDIVEDRARRGPFPSASALGRVPGIGPKTVQRLRPFLMTEADGFPACGPVPGRSRDRGDPTIQ
jgi:hypothetical protein